MHTSSEPVHLLDRAGALLRPAADTLGRSRVGGLLAGEWLGHPLHPALTDLPIGFWTSAMALDIVGGERARPSATSLVGLGLLSVAPTAAAGLVDWRQLSGERSRTGVVHAACNSAATVLYLASWRSRRTGRHARGVVLGFAGATVATVAGYLGGRLAFGET